MTREKVITILNLHRNTLSEMGVQSLELFGSTARGEAKAGSDVDLLIEFQSGIPIGFSHYFRVKEYLEQILGVAQVDLVFKDTVHNALKDSIFSEAVRV